MTTKKTFVLSTAIAALLSALAVSTSHAAVITWGAAQDITGDANVLNASNGGSQVLVGAFNVGDGAFPPVYGSVPGTTVNSVTFQPFVVDSAAGATTSAAAPGLLPLTNFTLAVGNSATEIFSSNNGLLPYGSPANPFASLTPEYKTLLQSATIVDTSMGNPSTFTLTMTGLVPSQAYQFQWWANASNGLTDINGVPIVGSQQHSASAGNTVILDDNNPVGGPATGGPGGLGQYAIGTFSADPTGTQVVTFSSVGAGTQFAMVNAFQLRTVPEPSTVLFGLALFGVCFGGRRRPVQETSKE